MAFKKPPHLSPSTSRALLSSPTKSLCHFEVPAVFVQKTADILSPACTPLPKQLFCQTSSLSINTPPKKLLQILICSVVEQASLYVTCQRPRWRRRPTPRCATSSPCTDAPPGCIRFVAYGAADKKGDGYGLESN